MHIIVLVIAAFFILDHFPFVFFRHLGTQWRLVLYDKNDQPHSFSHRDVFYFRQSICCRWYSLEFPKLHLLKNIMILSSNPVFFDRGGKPAAHRYNLALVPMFGRIDYVIHNQSCYNLFVYSISSFLNNANLNSYLI